MQKSILDLIYYTDVFEEVYGQIAFKRECCD